MDPWSIIGWLLVGLIALGTGIGALIVWDLALQPWLVARARHYRTRKTPPAVGQVWMQGNSTLTITDITDRGRVCMTTQLVVNGRRHGNGASWSDSMGDWHERVANRKLWLLKTDERHSIPRGPQGGE
jgi:hypothetical protein